VTRTDPTRVLAVAVGGVLGTWARWWVASTWPLRVDRFPTTTLAINVSGAVVLGVVIAVLVERRPHRPVAYTLLGTGVLGAFTTFSTLTVEVVLLVESGHVWRAGLYLATSLVLGVLALALGLTIARRATRHP
jgi:CrcB protein